KPIITWALRHIRADANAISGMSDDDAKAYMQKSGGALRIFYIDGNGTDTLSVQIHGAIDCALATLGSAQQSFLARYYRAQSVGSSSADHGELPRKLGWQLLQDAGADVVWKGAPLTTSPAHPSPKQCKANLKPFGDDWTALSDASPDDADSPAYEYA